MQPVAPLCSAVGIEPVRSSRVPFQSPLQFGAITEPFSGNRYCCRESNRLFGDPAFLRVTVMILLQIGQFPSENYSTRLLPSTHIALKCAPFRGPSEPKFVQSSPKPFLGHCRSPITAETRKTDAEFQSRGGKEKKQRTRDNR